MRHWSTVGGGAKLDLLQSVRRGRRRRLKRVAGAPPAALLAAAAVLALAGCGAAATSTSHPAHTASSPPVVKTATVTVKGSPETVLTNAKGDTLYYVTKDTPTKLFCTGSCASIWPPLTTSHSSVTAPSGASGSFTVLHGANGAQVEYNGHPLYTYTGDTGPDQSNGQGYLGIWFVATPGLAAASTGGQPSPSSSSGGYSY